MKAYGGKCSITGCAIEPLLEAAHIRSYLGPETNHITNGILLRADIHTLLDLGLLGVSADHRVVIADRLKGTDYADLAGTTLRLPASASDHPSAKSLAWQQNRSFT
jgi:putative restriction endonuclease